jgi:hypothetical protein
MLSLNFHRLDIKYSEFQIKCYEFLVIYPCFPIIRKLWVARKKLRGTEKFETDSEKIEMQFKNWIATQKMQIIILPSIFVCEIIISVSKKIILYSFFLLVFVYNIIWTWMYKTLLVSTSTTEGEGATPLPRAWYVETLHHHSSLRHHPSLHHIPRPDHIPPRKGIIRHLCWAKGGVGTKPPLIYIKTKKNWG